LPFLGRAAVLVKVKCLKFVPKFGYNCFPPSTFDKGLPGLLG